MPTYEGGHTSFFALDQKGEAAGFFKDKHKSISMIINVTNDVLNTTESYTLRYSEGNQVFLSGQITPGEYTLISYRLKVSGKESSDKFIGYSFMANPGEISYLPYTASLLKSINSTGHLMPLYNLQKDAQSSFIEKAKGKGWSIRMVD